MSSLFFFQAEDGIRDLYVTGVQTCALPIYGADGADANDGATPQSAKIEHLCCAHCTSAAPAIAPPDAPRAAPARLASRPLACSSFTVVIARGAVRAGPSQAPPTPA